MGPAVLKILLALTANATTVTECFVKQGKTESVDVGLAVYPTASLFNHSCDPDAHLTFSGDEVLVRCVKEVEKGRQVTIAYDGLSFALRSQEERRTLLARTRFFSCECEACLGSWPLAYELSLRPEYIRYVRRVMNDVTVNTSNFEPHVNLRLFFFRRACYDRNASSWILACVQKNSTNKWRKWKL